jgi:hypothetical protein
VFKKFVSNIQLDAPYKISLWIAILAMISNMLLNQKRLGNKSIKN